MSHVYTIQNRKARGVKITGLLLAGTLFLSFVSFGNAQPNIPGLRIWAIGAGQTTGHIGELHLHNTTNDPIRFSLGPLLIPSTDKIQGYALPDQLNLLIKPGGYRTVPLRGFCTNPFLPPAADGELLPAVEGWIEASKAPHWTPDMALPVDQGFRPVKERQAVFATFPGTDTLLGYTLDIDSFPNTAARLVIDMVQSVESTYAILNTEGSINTVFGDDARRQEDAVEQQAIWYALGLLEGNGYGIEVFRSGLAKQLETNIQIPLGQASEAIRVDFENGVQQFWAVFLLVGKQAKVIRARG